MFNAGTVVDPMDWDFTAFGEPTDKGTIPEPSTEAVDLFGQRYRGLLMALQAADINSRIPEDETPEEAAQRVIAEAQKPLHQRLEEWAEDTRLPDKDAQLVNEEMIRILADVCSGAPTEAQLRMLPSRVLRAFCTWLNEELTAPKFKHGVNG